MALYIFDKPYCDNGIPYVQMDEEGKVLLLQDALFLDIEKIPSKEVYAIDKDVEKRGLGSILQERVKRISYEQAIDLIAENKVINFA